MSESAISPLGGAATLEFGAASDQKVIFADGEAGTLKLGALAGFTGSVSGFVAGSDTIDLSTIDANAGVASDQAFAFAGNDVNTVANSITWSESGGNTILQIENTGDTTADMQIILFHPVDKEDRTPPGTPAGMF